MAAQDEERKKLRSFYCPPLDDATFLAIVSDYNLSSPTDRAEVCELLDMLASTAEVEEMTGFDPSGSSGPAATGQLNDANDKSDKSDSRDGSMPPPAARSASRGQCSTVESEFYSLSTTEHSSVTNSVANLSLVDDEETTSQRLEYTERNAEADAHIAELDTMTTEDKEAMLIEMFRGLKKFDIEWTLKKYDGDFGRCVEELLNQTFLEETGGRHKGIEGFSGSSNKTAQKKANRRGRNGRSTMGTETSEDTIREWSDAFNNPAVSTPSSVWEARQRDLETITKFTGVDQGYAIKLYKRNGDSVAASLNEIINEHTGLPESMEERVFDEVSRLLTVFPEIEFDRLVAIQAICAKTTASPDAFCEALLARPPSRRPSPPNIKVHYKPTRELIDQWNDVPARKRPATTGKSDYVSSYAAAAHAGDALIARRNENFSKAGAAYRKARSDPLMGGAAAYYAEEGRNYHARAKNLSSAAADALVARQSNSKELDLHGVNVVDAVRIAREKVTDWWVRLDKAPGASHGGYKIITGRGNNSVNGVANIRNAVGRMLIKEGWKADIGSGAIVVRGTTGVKRAYT